MFPAWYAGRNPHNSLIFGTYNERYALDVGRAVRDIMQSIGLRPGVPGPRAEVEQPGRRPAGDLDKGGIMAFVGRGGTITGRGGDVLIIDDPLKDRHEADSPTIRDLLWTWFTQVISSRMQDQSGRIMLIQTRWHQDDLIGRLTDPTNTYYDPKKPSRVAHHRYAGAGDRGREGRARAQAGRSALAQPVRHHVPAGAAAA
jgi:hypothetical protein